MALREIAPWRWGGLRHWREEERPFKSFRRDMEALHREMDRLFDDFWSDTGRSALPSSESNFGAVWPRIDEVEDDGSYRITAELPGMDEDDISVDLADGLLTIRGEKKQDEEEKSKDYFRQERTFGAFRRSMLIPRDIDESKIKASFKKGVLSIDLPKTEESQQKVKHIDIKAA